MPAKHHNLNNPLRLNPRPIPKHPMDFVFAKECPEGDPKMISPRLLVNTASEMKLLGRMYDKQVVMKHDGGGTPVFFGTQQSYLNMFKNRGLVDFIPRQINRYQLTQLGIRMYELNYWYEQWKKKYRKLEAQGIREDRAAGWINPKPDTDPYGLNRTTKDHSNLPAGVYPRLEDM